MSKAAELAKAGETLTNQPSGRKNLVTNGSMQVAQRSVSETGKGDASGYFTCDRWKVETDNSAGRFTMSQTADGPSGFANCLKLDCTTADTSIASDEYLIISHRLEGQDVQQFKKGTSDAEQITVSFYVKGDQAATYVVELFEQTNLRNNTQAFSVTTSWNRIELTFAADTTGVPADNNALGWQLNFWLHGGSDYTSGTFASNTWGSQTPANKYAGSKTSFYDSTDRELFITGVQMEIGSQATNFEHRSFGEELALCQRYYYRHADHSENSANSVIGVGFYYSSSVIMTYVPFKQTMRISTPTLEFASGSNYYILQRDGTTDGINDFTIGARGTNGCKIDNADESSGDAGKAGIMMTDNDASYIAFDAEL